MQIRQIIDVAAQEGAIGLDIGRFQAVFVLPDGLYVVRDEIEYAANQIIPLWMFGLLY